MVLRTERRMKLFRLDGDLLWRISAPRKFFAPYNLLPLGKWVANGQRWLRSSDIPFVWQLHKRGTCPRTRIRLRDCCLPG